MRVSIVRDPNLSPRLRRAVSAAGIGPLLRRSGDTLGVPSRARVVVRLTDDSELRALNHRFLGLDEPTDVLAFPGGDDRSLTRRDGKRVGDIAISVERALAQAEDGAQELRLLSVHGLLHCLGHDHADRDGAAAMTAATRQLLPDQAVPQL